jgi:hypothetical protein
MYVGLYTEYYPGGLNWRGYADPGREMFKVGQPRMKDANGVEMWSPWIYTTYSARGDMRCLPRCIAMASRSINNDHIPYYPETDSPAPDYDKINANQDWAGPDFYAGLKPPVLRTAPWGLGNLIYQNLIQDASVFYCPSARDRVFGWVWYNGRDYPNQTLGDWATAGGFDLNTFLFGKWPRVHRNYQYGEGRATAVMAQYDYRNQPIWSNYLGAGEKEATIYWTKPLIVGNQGSPPFKTTKLLGGRLVAHDSVERGPGAGTPLQMSLTAGFGMYAHKDGYNCLFGNYATRWYPDLNYRIAYWDQAKRTQLLPNGTYGFGDTTGWDGSLSDLMGCYGKIGAGLYRIPSLWHTIEVWFGIDVDAKAANDSTDP